MGQTPAATRREIEQTREELGQSLRELQQRRQDLPRQVARRAMPAAAGVGGVAALGVAALVTRSLLQRRRSRSPLQRLTDQRDRALQQFLRRLADEQVRAEHRQRPLWRRIGEDALKAAVTVAVTSAVRQAVQRTMSTRREADHG